MSVSPSNTIYSSPASYTRLSTEMSIDSSTVSHQQHVTSIYKVQATPTGTTPMCCGSSRIDDTIMLQAHRQSSHDLSKTITDSLLRNASVTQSVDPTRRQSARELFTTLQTDSLRTEKETYSTSKEQTHGQHILGPSTTLQMDALRTGKGPYSTSLEIAHGQITGDPSTTLQMDSLRTVKETYSANIDQRHGQNTLEPSYTLQMDSLKTLKGTYSACIDKTREQKTRSLSKSPQTDSLIIRTVKGTTNYGVSTVQGSFIAVEQSLKSSKFQKQSQESSFQVQPSFSSLSPTISPSLTGKQILKLEGLGFLVVCVQFTLGHQGFH